MGGGGGGGGSVAEIHVLNLFANKHAFKVIVDNFSLQQEIS